MLREIRIRDVGVIVDATLELSPGLTVITGETGAGKTMVVTGLGLLLGARADPSAVRTGAPSALVEGRFALAGSDAAARRATDSGAELDEGDLIIARTVTAAGAAAAPVTAGAPAARGGAPGPRSRVHLGGRSVPVAVLAEMADDLVAVHGQSEQVMLRSPARQREALDAFAGAALEEVASRYAPAWRRFGQVSAQVEALVAQESARAAERDLLRAALAEVERAAPRPGEDDELSAEAERLEHAEELAAAADRAHTALVGDDRAAAAGADADAATAVEAAKRALSLAAGHDAELDALAARVREVALLVTDVAADLASYSGSGAVAAADPQRLDAVQERRAELTALARARGGQGVADLLAWVERSTARLAELEQAGGSVADLAAERDALDAELVDLAAAMSERRAAAAAALGAAATAELPGLSMPHAALEVVVTSAGATSAADLGPHGADEVALLLGAPGSAARPLGRGASGGELSRVMLALELVLAASSEVPTFVFDEVDAGVGGRAAVGIGERLARLARTRQVVVVTHLPQVAAFADAHVRVAKVHAEQDGGLVTVSGVAPLDGEERVAELARMLAGQERSESARAHARELLALRTP